MDRLDKAIILARGRNRVPDSATLKKWITTPTAAGRAIGGAR